MLGHPLEHALALERGERDFLAGVAAGLNVADVDDHRRHVPGAVAEAALGRAAVERRLAALEQRLEHLGAGAGVLALAAARGGLAVPAADAAADALLELVLVNAGVNGAEVHQIATPRRRCTSSRVRSSSRPAMVALTRLIGL